MWKEGDTLLDDLNRRIEFIMGKSISSYYIPSESESERERTHTIQGATEKVVPS